MTKVISALIHIHILTIPEQSVQPFHREKDATKFTTAPLSPGQCYLFICQLIASSFIASCVKITLKKGIPKENVVKVTQILTLLQIGFLPPQRQRVEQYSIVT